jgi:hypothetical protein
MVTNGFIGVLFGEFYLPVSPVCTVKYLISKEVSTGHRWRARLDFIVKNHIVLLVLAKY